MKTINDNSRLEKLIESESFSGDSTKIVERLAEYEKEMNEFCEELYLKSAYKWYLKDTTDDIPLSFEEWVKIEENKEK